MKLQSGDGDPHLVLSLALMLPLLPAADNDPEASDDCGHDPRDRRARFGTFRLLSASSGV
jgi:hypothetical protein